MVDNIPPEELEIELSGRQIEQLDAIDNTVYQNDPHLPQQDGR